MKVKVTLWTAISTFYITTLRDSAVHTWAKHQEVILQYSSSWEWLRTSSRLGVATDGGQIYVTNSGQGERSKRAAVLTVEGWRGEGPQGMLRGRGCVNKHDGHVRYQLSGCLETDSEQHNRAGIYCTRGIQENLWERNIRNKSGEMFYHQ